MIHTPNRTEQTHERRCRTYGCKHRKAVFQPCRFLVDDLAYGTSYEGARRPLLFKLERTVLGMVVACMNGMAGRSEEHTSELQSLMRISYAVFCLKKKK